jgi:hypothetical protein
MQNNQPVLISILFLLVLIVGFLLYDRGHYSHNDDTLGEKVGHTIDRATGTRK